jgi:hypothetical protein
MKILFRVLASSLLLLALLLLVNCTGAPGCPQASFGGGAACGPGGNGSFGNGGGGGGGGGGATPAAFVYAVDQTGGSSGTSSTGTIDGFDLSTSAASFVALTNYTAPQVPIDNPGQAMVVVQKQFVYALFDTTNQLFGWSVNSQSGALTSLNNFPITVGNLPNTAYNQYNITSDPGGNYLFVAQTGFNTILVYTVNSTTGALTLAQTVLTPIEPGNLTTDGLGKYLYVCEDVSGHTGFEVLAYVIGTGGTLSPVPGTFNFPMWQLQGDPTGNYLIGTTGKTALLAGADDNHLYVFSINRTTNPGAISQVSTAITSYSPFNIVVSPPSSNEEFVYSFSINDTAAAYNAIEGYQLNTTTSGSVTAGSLTKLSNSPFLSLANSGAIGLWGQFDQSGQNLVVYSNTGAINLFDEFVTGTGAVTLTPLSVDTSGNLTQPITTPASLVTPGYWVVTDP